MWPGPPTHHPSADGQHLAGALPSRGFRWSSLGPGFASRPREESSTATEWAEAGASKRG
jgi:hypothetical protein